MYRFLHHSGGVRVQDRDIAFTYKRLCEKGPSGAKGPFALYLVPPSLDHVTLNMLSAWNILETVTLPPLYAELPRGLAVPAPVFPNYALDKRKSDWVTSSGASSESAASSGGPGLPGYVVWKSLRRSFACSRCSASS